MVEYMGTRLALCRKLQRPGLHSRVCLTSARRRKGSSLSLHTPGSPCR